MDQTYTIVTIIKDIAIFNSLFIFITIWLFKILEHRLEYKKQELKNNNNDSTATF